MSRLADIVCNIFGISTDVLRRRTKNAPIRDARKVFCYIGSKEMETPQPAIGEYLGISASGVWLLFRQAKAIMEKRIMKSVC